MQKTGASQGRPRDAAIDAAVLRAARELLGEAGYGGVTMDATAARAGVGKAAIYRRFGSKAELLFTATVHGTDIEPPPDQGSLRADLRALVRLVHGMLSGPAVREVAPQLLAEMGRDPALVARFQDTFVARQREDVTAVLDRAVERGELVRGPDPVVAHLLVGGPLFMSLIAFHAPLDDVLLDGVADTVAAGLTAGG